MGKPLKLPRFERAAYFAWEDAQTTRNEYLSGEVFAMVGARRVHALVALSLGSRFRAHLRGTPCQTYMSDMKLEVDAADAVFYPDVMVSCDPADRRAEIALHGPCLVVEALSDSTAAYDRGRKFAAYRQLPSLQEYLLVDLDERRLELFRKEPVGSAGSGTWTLHETTLAQPRMHLASIALDLNLDEVFEDLTEDPPESASGEAAA